MGSRKRPTTLGVKEDVGEQASATVSEPVSRIISYSGEPQSRFPFEDVIAASNVMGDSSLPAVKGEYLVDSTMRCLLEFYKCPECKFYTLDKKIRLCGDKKVHCAYCHEEEGNT